MGVKSFLLMLSSTETIAPFQNSKYELSLKLHTIEVPKLTSLMFTGEYTFPQYASMLMHIYYLGYTLFGFER